MTGTGSVHTFWYSALTKSSCRQYCLDIVHSHALGRKFITNYVQIVYYCESMQLVFSMLKPRRSQDSVSDQQTDYV